MTFYNDHGQTAMVRRTEHVSAPNITPAKQQAAEFETRRKLDLVVEYLTMQARARQNARAYGRVLVELIYENGKITRAKLVDEVTIGDLSDKERELVLRQNSDNSQG